MAKKPAERSVQASGGQFSRRDLIVACGAASVLATGLFHDTHARDGGTPEQRSGLGRPYIICHMISSIDGRIVSEHWPSQTTSDFIDVYKRTQRQLRSDAWMLGRATMAKFSEGAPRPIEAGESYPRTTWKAPGAEKGPYGVTVDRKGSLHLNVDRLQGNPIIVVLSESVADNYLAELRRDRISYLFAGQNEVELPLAMRLLTEEFGIRRLILEGGGTINGAMLSADLIDELLVMIMPIVDGTEGLASLFDRPSGSARTLALQSIQRLEQDRLLLKYTITGRS